MQTGGATRGKSNKPAGRRWASGMPGKASVRLRRGDYAEIRSPALIFHSHSPQPGAGSNSPLIKDNPNCAFEKPQRAALEPSVNAATSNGKLIRIAFGRSTSTHIAPTKLPRCGAEATLRFAIRELLTRARTSVFRAACVVWTGAFFVDGAGGQARGAP